MFNNSKLEVLKTHLQSNLAQALGNIKDLRIVHKTLTLARSGWEFTGQCILKALDDGRFATTVFAQDQREWGAECYFLFVAL